jgi:hypothetical protein
MWNKHFWQAPQQATKFCGVSFAQTGVEQLDYHATSTISTTL